MGSAADAPRPMDKSRIRSSLFYGLHGLMHGLRAVIACAALNGCSLLIDVGGDQCVQSSDCGGVGFESTCERGICVRIDESAASCDGGSCGESGNSGGNDASSEASAIGSSCLASQRCVDDGICFKDQCVLERDVGRFICEPGAPVQLDTIHFTMPVLDFVTEVPPADLVVLACNENDVNCVAPIARFDDTMGTGNVVFDLPYEFGGYLEISSPEALTSLWYLTRPLVKDTSSKVVKVVSSATVGLLAMLTENQWDPTKGLVILEAFDCEELAVGGIHFEDSKQVGIPFFIIDGQPNTESKVSVRSEVDNQAAGGFLNAKPGFTIFTARIGVDGPVLGTFNANVRVNTVTYLDIHP